MIDNRKYKQVAAGFETLAIQCSIAIQFSNQTSKLSSSWTVLSFEFAKPIAPKHFLSSTMPPTHLLTSLFLLLATHSYGQKLKKNFTGQIEYDVQYYSDYITRDSCGDYASSRILTRNNDFFEIRDTSTLDNEGKHYLPTKFVKNKNLLQMVYYNPTKLDNDTIDQFPLNKGDTIVSNEEYLVHADSFSLWNPEDSLWHFKEVGMSTDKLSGTTNIGDTIITLLGHRYNCYRFEKFNYNMKSYPSPSHKRTIIYIDKKTLLPLREDWFRWYIKHPCKNPREWSLSQKVEIIGIRKNS
jgi:hypothetical protein